MLYAQEWNLNQQIVLASADELQVQLPLKDYTNLSIALQFRMKGTPMTPEEEAAYNAAIAEGEENGNIQT